MTSLFYTGWLMRRNLRPIPSGSGQKLQPEPTPSIFKLSAHAPELKRGDLQPRYFRHLTRIGHPRRPRCSGVIKKGVRRGAGWSIGGLHGPQSFMSIGRGVVCGVCGSHDDATDRRMTDGPRSARPARHEYIGVANGSPCSGFTKRLPRWTLGEMAHSGKNVTR